MIKREAGVEHRDLKSLRHTFATYCLEVGVSMRMLQLYLGHRSIKTTELYGAISKALMLAENKKLTAAFNDSEAA
jgi:integrase/recombinase XerD